MHSTNPFLGAAPGEPFAVVNLGCKVNRVESDTIAAALTSKGCVAADLEDAALVIVNTCTVTSEADKKARKAVRHALNCAPRARVIVTGCAVAIDANTYESLDERIAVIQRGELLASLRDDPCNSQLRIGRDYPTRVSIKAQDGCNRACTYCIVHIARGPAMSVPLEDVLGEARRYLSAGVNELVLTGIDLGSYCSHGARLHDLVGELLEFADRFATPGQPAARIRASSLEPHSITEEFIDLLASADGRLCRHVHLPLQSGSSKVLKEMARPYSAADFQELVDHLYARVPSMSITTDVICGFPGETDDEFNETQSLARRCRFSKIHVFPYSLRAGTPAALREDQIDVEQKAKRAALMRKLATELRNADRANRCGSHEYALVEDNHCLTESYHELPTPPGAEVGSLVRVTL